MTYAILQISAEAYGDILNRLLALDRDLLAVPSYQGEYVEPAGRGKPERLVFGPVAFEALPPELVTVADVRERETPPHVDDLNDAVLVGLAIEDDARALWEAINLPGDHAWDDVKELAAGARIMAGARVLRRRYLPWTLDDWTPSRETINALPKPLRDYIMELETICDPAGEVLTHHQVRQQAAGVEAMYLESERLLAGVRRIMHKWETIGLQSKDAYLGEISMLLSKTPGVARGLLAGETAEEFRQRQVDEVDGRRWRALLEAAPRLIGAAGVEYPDGEPARVDPKHDGYIHAGVEFWTRAGPQWIGRGKNGEAAAVLTLIADQIIAQGGEAWAMVNGERVVTPGSQDADT